MRSFLGMIISVNLVCFHGIIKLEASNTLLQESNRETWKLKSERNPLELLILEFMNIYEEYNSGKSYCDGSLYLKVNKRTK